jgi:hypothetical protein
LPILRRITSLRSPHHAAAFVIVQKHFGRRNVCYALQFEIDKEYLEILALNADILALEAHISEATRGVGKSTIAPNAR